MEEQNMLFEVLGVALAFASIMLLFSLFVTAIVQATQSLFNHRYHNLKIGLLRVGENLQDIPKEYFEGIDSLLSYGAKAPEKEAPLMARFNYFNRIKKTEITSEQLEEYVRNQCDGFGIDDLVKKVQMNFSEIEQYMIKRFQRIMHVWSIAVALCIAFVFQLNTLDLLRQVSTDPNLRDKYIEMVSETNAAFDALSKTTSYPDSLKQSLVKLADSHPAIRENIEVETVEVETVSEALRLLKTALDDDSLQKEYRSVLANTLEANKRESLETLDRLAFIGSTHNFSLWPYGWDYYFGGMSYLNNIIGTLISGILISLGAPFWFNAIRNISSLRDRTSRR